MRGSLSNFRSRVVKFAGGYFGFAREKNPLEDTEVKKLVAFLLREKPKKPENKAFLFADFEVCHFLRTRYRTLIKRRVVVGERRLPVGIPHPHPLRRSFCTSQQGHEQP